MCFASERSQFCFPEAAAGFLPAGGGSTLLPLKTGSGRALEVMLACRDFTGKEAEQYHFVNRSFATAEELDDYVSDVIKRISANNRDAILAVKSVTRKTSSLMRESILAGLAQENESMYQCLADQVVIANIRKLAAVTGSRDTELDLLATITSTTEI
jgi:enoyl-CoA hydratase/carnithine racemase